MIVMGNHFTFQDGRSRTAFLKKNLYAVFSRERLDCEQSLSFPRVARVATPLRCEQQAASSESAAYVPPTLSLTNVAENSSNTSPNVVIAAPRYKEMRIAFA